MGNIHVLFSGTPDPGTSEQGELTDILGSVRRSGSIWVIPCLPPGAVLIFSQASFIYSGFFRHNVTPLFLAPQFRYSRSWIRSAWLLLAFDLQKYSFSPMHSQPLHLLSTSAAGASWGMPFHQQIVSPKQQLQKAG